MTQKELIIKLRQLRQIEPRKDWVILTKNQILGESDRGRASINFFLLNALSFITLFGRKEKLQYLFGQLYQKPALVFLSAFAIILFIGGLIFYFPKELGPVSQTEEIENLSPALEELQQQVSQTTQGLKKIGEPKRILQVSREIIPVMENGKAIISASKKLLKEELELKDKDLKDKDKEGTVRVLAIEISETEKAFGEMKTVFSQLVQDLINDLEKRTLTQEQAEILKEAKKDFENKEFEKALEKILFLNNIR